MNMMLLLLWIMFIMVLYEIKERVCRPVEAVAFLPSLTNRRGNRVEQSRSYSCSSRSSTLSLSSSTLSSSSVPIREEIRYIAGRRALILHPSNDIRDNNDNNDNLQQQQQQTPPLVVLGGMAQSISSWEFHLPYLAKQRSVLIYEGLGQGPLPPHIELQQYATSIEEYYDNVTLERQGHDFWKVVDEAFFAPGCYYYNNNNIMNNSTTNLVVDVACFSFGARVALAAATIVPNRVRRMHLTGVGAERDVLANIHIESWKEMLSCTKNPVCDDEMIEGEHHDGDGPKKKKRSHRLRSFAWSIILATYSEKFLISAGPDRMKTWVDGVCRYNTEDGIRAILMQTHDDNDEEWSPASMAQRILLQQQHSSNKSESFIDSCRIVVGSEDKMANPNQAYQLAKILSRNTKNKEDDDDSIYKVMEGCGHAVPMEAMRLWREDVLQYLNR